MKKFLLIGGVSGSGKSYVEDMLYTHIGDEHTRFHRLFQYTTRPARDEEVEGDSYFFIDKDRWEEIKDDLIAKTHFYGNDYGTMDDSEECTPNVQVINTIVVSAEGMRNAEKDIKEKYGKDALVCKVIIKSDSIVSREGRSEEDVQEELDELLEVTPNVLENNVDDRLVYDDVVKFLKDEEFID